jgi:hypothetical protein
VVKKGTISRTPSDVRAAVEAAERELVRPSDGKQQRVQLQPKGITTKPELFQPRGFANGFLDQEHVYKLVKHIEAKGELEPPLVVKLGKKWVCVDGHHRVAAYVKRNTAGKPETISCLWFPGTVREAVDESVRRNDVLKLPMRRSEKLEAAWQRVVLHWGSKRDIAKLTGVSERLVANMRAALRAYEGEEGRARLLRNKIGGDIRDASWSLVRNAINNITPAEWDHKKEAAKLAATLRSRLHDRLSDNPIVTALALAMYDERLPRRLVAELPNTIREMQQEDQEDLRSAIPAEGEGVDELRSERWDLIEKHRQVGERIQQIETALNSRDLAGDPFGPAPAPSDKTWQDWVMADTSPTGDGEG